MGHSDSTDLYVLQVPGHAKHDLARTLHPVQVLPAHEQFAEHMASDYVCRHKLSKLYRKNKFPPIYWDHPVVKRYATEDIVVLPVAVYIDAVPFSQTDSVLGFWLVKLINA